MNRDTIYARIEKERMRQQAKWGADHDQSHRSSEWAGIVTERLSKALLPETDWVEEKERRLVELAAVVVAWLETT